MAFDEEAVNPLLSGGLVVATIAVGVLLALLGGFFFWGHKSAYDEAEQRLNKSKEEDSEPLGPLEEEDWVPKLEVVDWKEAHTLVGCPWSFQHCDNLDDVTASIWHEPVCKELLTGYTALKERVKSIRVAKAVLAFKKEVSFCIVYQLKTGAELFGGPPCLELAETERSNSNDSQAGFKGLRRRLTSKGSSGASTAQHGLTLDKQKGPKLRCLSPFLRIHDGFGVLMSSKHLPLVLETPNDYVSGSCYYVYPTHAMQPLIGRPNLLKFARVDKSCIVCADYRQEQPGVVYVERSGNHTEDDEHPLVFIADTVSNISGQRVVPPPYEGGPSAYATASGVTLF